jgi:hypothetical protein
VEQVCGAGMWSSQEVLNSRGDTLRCARNIPSSTCSNGELPNAIPYKTHPSDYQSQQDVLRNNRYEDVGVSVVTDAVMDCQEPWAR